MTGIFVTLEGADGSGKTTQWQLVQDYLQAKKIPNICIREPGSTLLGESLRTIIKDPGVIMDPITEAYVYAACRAQLVAQVIKPALDEGKIVVCDRFLDSSIVYQGGARKLGIVAIQEINKHAVFGLEPNITFFIDVPVDVSMHRASTRAGTCTDTKEKDRIDMEGVDFHSAVYEGYKKLASRHKRIITIDGMQSIESINTQIVNTIEKELQKLRLGKVPLN
ncbi:MAG: dTMP kinase [Defluviitaleaceae bacterium]|nr:dTMP kinase [Defluviitaleaceae bacterium]